jgi:predicted RNase H-like nuclease
MRNETACEKGLSCQAFGILRRIEQVGTLMDSRRQANIREGHPEVTFAKLKGSFVQSPKKSQTGRTERMAILQAAGIKFDVEVERQKLKSKFVSRDDILDGVAMMVSAKRLFEGSALVLGDGAMDCRGLRMEMVA